MFLSKCMFYGEKTLNVILVTIAFVKMMTYITNNTNNQKIYNSVAAGYPVRRRCKNNKTLH